MLDAVAPGTDACHYNDVSFERLVVFVENIPLAKDSGEKYHLGLGNFVKSTPLVKESGPKSDSWVRHIPVSCPRNNKSTRPIMKSSNENIFRVTGPLCGEFASHRWLPHTKASDAELWCFLCDLSLNKWLSKQSWGWWSETPSCSLWRHCNGPCICKALHGAMKAFHFIFGHTAKQCRCSSLHTSTHLPFWFGWDYLHCIVPTI